MVESVKDFYLIGLTGNLGSGKSTVRRMLEQLGARGIDADLLAHAAMERGTPAWDAAVKTFGAEILRYDGEIDRQALGKLVFEDPEALGRLEKVLHPAVGELVRRILRENAKPVVVLEAIKLIESDLYRWCDALWVVTCSTESQVERVVRDRQMRPEDARARLAAQSAQDEKVRLANVIIDNSGDTSATNAQVQKAWADTVHVERARDKSAWLIDKGPASEPSVPTQPVAETPAIAPAPAPEGTSAPASPTPTAPAKSPAPAPAPKVTSAPAAPTPTAPAAPTPTAPAAPTPTAPAAPKPLTEEKAKIPERRAAPAPQKAPPAPRDFLVQVRPARRSDLDALSKALARSEGRREPLSPAETMKRLGERGYRIALAQGRIVAMAAWEAENLVAVTRDIRAESPEIARQALPPLLALIEQDANSLVCEVSILLVDARTPSIVSSLASTSGYHLRDLNALHKVWRQMISERRRFEEKIWVKPLRKELITRPVE